MELELPYYIANKKLLADSRDNNKKISVQYITDRRIEWVSAVRDITADYIGISLLIADTYKIKNRGQNIPNDLNLEMNQLIAKMKLFYNYRGKYDNEILKLVDSITGNLSNEEFHPQLFLDEIFLLEKYSQIYLKIEWERVKKETYQNLTDKEKIFHENLKDGKRILCRN